MDYFEKKMFIYFSIDFRGRREKIVRYLARLALGAERRGVRPSTSSLEGGRLMEHICHEIAAQIILHLLYI